MVAVLSAAAVAGWIAAQPPMTPEQLYALVDLADGLVYGAVAWLILGRRTGLVGWIVAAAAVGGAVAALGTQWAALADRHPGLWAPALLTGAHGWAWVPGLYGLLVLLPWLLPTGAARRRPWTAGRVLRAGVLAAGACCVTAATAVAMTAPAPYGIVPLSGPRLHWIRAEVLGPVSQWLVPLGFAATTGVLVRRRVTDRPRRHGLGWLAVGSALLTLAFGLSYLPQPLAERLPAQAPALLMLASQLFFPAAVLVVVLRQQLWGIEVAVRRTLVWLLMTAAVIAAYTGGVLLLDHLLPAGSYAPKVLVTAALAAAFQPVRQWVQRRVDRLVHGEAHEPLMRQVARRLGSAGPDLHMIDTVAAAIASSLRLERVTISVHDGRARPEQRETGAAPPIRVPLVSGQRTVGELVAWPRTGERLGGRAAAALADLAPVAGAVVDLVATNRALAGSRSRLAEARDEERRALRRDLHDGLGPALSGIGLGLAATRNLLHRDPAAAEALLDRLAEEMSQRAESVRHLARALLPADLADGRLVPALHTLAERYALAGLDMRVCAPAEPAPLPGLVATAAYGVIAEAVRNVHRHAGVGVCEVRIEQDEELRVTVSDHGGGPPQARSAGLGLRSMRERAEGVGATLTVGATMAGAVPTGTTVRLVVPAVAVAA
ncbi:hypothetical protein Cba03nite_48750 [Catellatospora bangladeshensis]|uniref:histidine kinase n=1 Tax=Catellatospora bangladeshensis TaxID=310355 RepID=A0A8J3JFD6_9ACTN|nr:hypothetical protein Cba03nite_48750 [Catellatospora bangladeshensis]